jgi:hypothetical protein
VKPNITSDIKIPSTAKKKKLLKLNLKQHQHIATPLVCQKIILQYRGQFQQHFMSSFGANFIALKKINSKL